MAFTVSRCLFDEKHFPQSISRLLARGSSPNFPPAEENQETPLAGDGRVTKSTSDSLELNLEAPNTGNE